MQVSRLQGARPGGLRLVLAPLWVHPEGNDVKKMMIALATCAACAIATGQPMPQPHEGDHMENHDMDHREADHHAMVREAPAPHHQEHKVWLPTRHDEHGHRVPGHYEYR